MNSKYLIKQAVSPGTGAILSVGIGGGVGYLLDKWKEHNGEEVENKWIRPTLFAALATTPALLYGLARNSYDRSPADGKHSLGFFNRWFSNDNDFWNNSAYANYNLDQRNLNYMKTMSDDWQNKYLYPTKQSSFDPLINVNAFNQEVWNDASMGNTPVSSAGFVSNTLNQTSQRTGSGFVTPGQVLGTMVNAGIGYGTSWLASKALGALAGISPQTQNKLQEIGTWGGIIGGIGNAASHY